MSVVLLVLILSVYNLYIITTKFKYIPFKITFNEILCLIGFLSFSVQIINNRSIISIMSLYYPYLLSLSLYRYFYIKKKKNYRSITSRSRSVRYFSYSRILCFRDWTLKQKGFVAVNNIFGFVLCIRSMILVHSNPGLSYGYRLLLYVSDTIKK